jgi:hypothetical protein
MDILRQVRALVPILAAVAALLAFPGAARSATPESTAAALRDLRLVNYYPSAGAWTAMWTSWRPADVDRDFGRIAALGGNAVRLVVFPDTFGYPLPRPEMTDRLRAAIAMAAARGLRVELTLFDWWAGYRDVLGSQLWTAALLGPLAGDPRIAAIEIKNEIDPRDPDAVAWAAQLIPFTVRAGGGIPVTVSVSDAAGVEGLQALRQGLGAGQPDFFSFHFYAGGRGEAAYDSMRRARAAVAPVPLFVGETGRSDLDPVAGAGEAEQDHFLRSAMLAARRLGLPPVAPWMLLDLAPGAVPSQARVAANPAEYRMGLLRLDGSRKPAAASVAAYFAGAPVDASFNNGFEAATAAALPREWRRFAPGEAAFARDARVRRSGRGSARISAARGGPFRAPAFQVSPVDGGVEPGRLCELEVWARGRRASGSTRAAIAWFDAAGRYLGQAQSTELRHGTTRWRRLRAVAVAPPGAASVQIHLKSTRNRGAVWFDDVTFRARP